MKSPTKGLASKATQGTVRGATNGAMGYMVVRRAAGSRCVCGDGPLRMVPAREGAAAFLRCDVCDYQVPVLFWQGKALHVYGAITTPMGYLACAYEHEVYWTGRCVGGRYDLFCVAPLANVPPGGRSYCGVRLTLYPGGRYGFKGGIQPNINATKAWVLSNILAAVDEDRHAGWVTLRDLPAPPMGMAAVRASVARCVKAGLLHVNMGQDGKVLSFFAPPNLQVPGYLVTEDGALWLSWARDQGLVKEEVEV